MVGYNDRKHKDTCKQGEESNRDFVSEKKGGKSSEPVGVD